MPGDSEGSQASTKTNPQNEQVESLTGLLGKSAWNDIASTVEGPHALDWRYRVPHSEGNQKDHC